MGLVRKILSPRGAAAAAGFGVGYGIGYGISYFYSATTLITPLGQDDPLMKSDLLRLLNRYENPIMSDLCIRRIPLSSIRPELRDDEAALSTAFCRAVWSGWGKSRLCNIVTPIYQKATYL